MTTTQPQPATAAQDDDTLARRVRQEIERTILRGIKGLDYLSTSDPPVGQTTKEVIHKRGTLQLFHYHPQSDEVYRVPVLLIMSLVSKPYILDLAPGQSVIEFLLQRGYDVYLIDWGTPRPEDKRLRLEDYVLDFMPESIAKVQAASGETDVTMIGYCMGGLLSVLYAALHQDGPLKSLACFTTPIDFDGMGLFRRWTDAKHFDVDRIVDALGNVPPQLLYASFNMLRPASQAAGRMRLWDNMWNDEYVESYRRFDRWAADQIPFPGECFRQTTKELQQQNRLVKGEFTLAGRPVLLSDIRVPLLHVMAEHDHIVPYEAARGLVPRAGSTDKQDLVLKGGHVSLVTGARAKTRLWPQLDEWLAKRSE